MGCYIGKLSDHVQAPRQHLPLRRDAGMDRASATLKWLLEGNGHRCVSFVEINPEPLIWCRRTRCVLLTDAESTSEEIPRYLADLLAADGHGCVTFEKMTPRKLTWCEKSECTRANQA